MENQSDLFQEFNDSYEYASRGKRFANYLIDLVMYYILFFTITFIMGMAAPELVQNLESDISATLIIYLIAFSLMVGYYTLFEAYANGRTIGKMMTGTRAIKLDGTKLTPKDALLRSLSRLVPFEVFSGFGVPWHDSWTNTTVVENKKQPY